MVASVGTLTTLGACTGAIEDTGSEPSSSSGPSSLQPGQLSGGIDCSNLNVGRSPLRRLTRLQYDNAIRDLLDIDDRPSESISPDERIGPFYSNSITPITDLQVGQYQEVAEALAARADLAPWLGCDAASGDAACAQGFIQNFGKRAYRRPLTAEEQASYTALYEVAQVNGFDHAVRLVLSTMLQSQHFLYHVELGQGADAAPSATPVPLTPYELSSRLSFFLWGTTPDDELFALADSGELKNPETLSAQVERMLNDPRARQAIGLFHSQWLGVDRLPGMSKDSDLFPDYNGQVANAAVNETRDFADYVIRSGDGRLATLLTAPFSVVEDPLLDLYGITRPTGAEASTPIDLNAEQRAGLLTQPAFLAVTAHTDQTSPVHRGLLVRQNILCETIPSPPPDVDATPPQVMAGVSTRERFAQHDADPACAACHSMMDPIGLGFEHYDAIGRYRTEDGGVTVDARGQITNAKDEVLQGEFDGALELAERLSQSPQVADCVSRQWFRYALGRVESGDDACTMNDITDRFAGSDHNVRDLIVALVTSDAFRVVRLAGAAQEGL